MEREEKRQLLVVRLHADEGIDIPADATVLNSWVETATAQGSGAGTVLVLVDVRVSEAECEAAWARRWTLAAGMPGGQRGGENGHAANAHQAAVIQGVAQSPGQSVSATAMAERESNASVR